MSHTMSFAKSYFLPEWKPETPINGYGDGDGEKNSYHFPSLPIHNMEKELKCDSI